MPEGGARYQNLCHLSFASKFVVKVYLKTSIFKVKLPYRVCFVSMSSDLFKGPCPGKGLKSPLNVLFMQFFVLSFLVCE